MPHFFGIETLGHGPGGFIEGTTLDTGQTITGQTVDIATSLSESFQSSLSIFNNILSGFGLPETQRQALVTTNLIGLGEASLDISKALNEQITIREDQLARTQESIRNQQIAQTSINEQFTSALGSLTKSLGDLGKGGVGGFDPIKFFTDNPLIGGIGIGGLAVGAVVLLLVLKK